MNGEIHTFKFASFRLDVVERQLLHNDSPVPLTPKAFDVLAFIVERSGHLVEKEELICAVWPEAFVEEANLARVVHVLRRALSQNGDESKFIETVAKKGYRFVAAVEVLDAVPLADKSDASKIVNAPTEDTPKKITREGDPATNDPNIKTGNKRTHARTPKNQRPIWLFPIAAIGVITAACLLVLASWFPNLKDRRTTQPDARRTPQTWSGEALQNYTQGRFLVERRHNGDHDKALEMFENAIELDTNYADAYAGKADAKVIAFWLSSSHEDISQVQRAARKAVALDASNSYGHTVLCRILTTYDWDHIEAEKECRIATELDPNDQEAQKELAFLFSSLGRESDAMTAIDKAIAIAPTSFNKRSRGMILYQWRHYDEAIAQLEQVEASDPLYTETARWIISSYQMKRDYDAALVRYLSLLKESGNTPEEIAAIKASYQAIGWPAVLRKIADSSKAKNIFLAGTYAQLGEKENAFATLEAMIKKRSAMLMTVAREPALDPLRDDPRFDRILATLNFK